jgi:DNA-binding beta-propeller fold protein YncE
MSVRRVVSGIICAALLTAGTALAQQKGGLGETGPYEVVPNWFKPGSERWDQRITGVVADTPDRIFIGAVNRHEVRAGFPVLGPDGKLLSEKTVAAAKDADPAQMDVNTLMVLNRDGKVIENWKQWDGEIDMPHNLAISPYDPERHLWVIDSAGHQILKFTNDGKKLVLRIGEHGVPGTDKTHLEGPEGLTFLPDGSFYVASGDTIAKVVKFDKNGKFQLEFGAKGSGPGQFDNIHAITVDSMRRVIVGDRSYKRVQVFDATGKFLEQWPNIPNPTRIVATEDGAIWLASAALNRFAKFDTSGTLLGTWGAFGTDPGLLSNPHQFSVDREGNLYEADDLNNRVQKFVPRKNGDKSLVMAQELKLK